MVGKASLIFLIVSLLWVSLSQAREGKVFFQNGRWLKGDIQVQKESSGREIVVIALKSGSITVDKSQVKNIVYPVRYEKAKLSNGVNPVRSRPAKRAPSSSHYEERSDKVIPIESGLPRPYMSGLAMTSKWKLNLSHHSPFDPYIQEASAKNQLDPKLIKAVIKQESNFKTKNVSPKGAKGLMQLMPETAKILGVQDIFDPRENIHAGTRYLRTMLEHFNWDIPYALAAYNAGPGAVKKYGTIPPYQETEDYVRRVMSYYHSSLNPLSMGKGNQLFAFMDKKGNLVITDLPYLP